MRICLGIFLLLTVPVLAAPPQPGWYTSFQAYSLHEHTTDVKLYNTTPGAGAVYRTERWFAGGGVFRNSLGRWAGFGYWGRQWPVGPVMAGGIAGATHRYNANNGGLVPLAAGVVSIPVGSRLVIDLIAIPRVSTFTYNTLNLSFEWRVK